MVGSPDNDAHVLVARHERRVKPVAFVVSFARDTSKVSTTRSSPRRVDHFTCKPAPGLHTIVASTPSVFASARFTFAASAA